jgi:hypothetical protein
MREFRLVLRCSWVLLSSGDVAQHWLVGTDVSGEPIGPISNLRDP